MNIAPAPASAPAASPSSVLVSQTIDVRTTARPDGSALQWATERELRLAGAAAGIDTFASVPDAVRDARALSAGEQPGLAVVTWRGGYRLHDVRTTSRTYWTSTPHGAHPPLTRETKHSSVPFAAGNLRPEGDAAATPALVRSAALVALIDGDRTFIPGGAPVQHGSPRLIEIFPLPH